MKIRGIRFRWGLSATLTVMVVLVVGVLISASTVATIQDHRAVAIEALEQQGVFLAETFGEVMADKLYFADVDAIDDMASVAVSHPEITSVSVFRPDGRLLVSTAGGDYPEGAAELGVMNLALSPDRQVLATSQDQIIVFSPIVAGDQMLGGLQLSMNTDHVENDVANLIRQAILQGVTLIIVGALLAFLLGQYIARPIRRLVAATQRVAEGTYEFTAGRPRRDEIGELAAAFENMTVALSESNARLKDQSDQLMSSKVALEAEVLHRKGTEAELRTAQSELEKRVEERTAALRASEEEARALSRKLVGVQEEGFRYVSRELHDEIGQHLTGLKFLLESITGETSEAVVGRARAVVDELTATTHDLSMSLRPTVLDDMGLLPALLWLIRRYSSQSSIQVKFEHYGLGSRLPTDVETAAFRIVQEGLTNIARHAETTEADLTVWVGDGRLRISLADRGVGFDPESVTAQADSMGLVGMRERAQLLGGDLFIESSPGSGTRLRANLPTASVRAPQRQE